MGNFKKVIFVILIIFLVMPIKAGENTMTVYDKIVKYAKEFSIDPALFMALIEQESDFNPNDELYEPNTASGPDYSCGLTQILTHTAAGLGFKLSGNLETDKEALKDIDKNLYYGAKYLRNRMNRYKDLPLIDQIRTYNSGSPLKTTSSFYESNQQYGTNIMKNYEKWKKRMNEASLHSNIKTAFVAGVLGSMAIWLDKNFLG
jgi:soluble lytic murein transglycosylase-like protein